MVLIFPYWDCILNRVNLRIQSKYGKMWTRKSSVFEHFWQSEASSLMFRRVCVYGSVVMLTGEKKKRKLIVERKVLKWKLITFDNVVFCYFHTDFSKWFKIISLRSWWLQAFQKSSIFWCFSKVNKGIENLVRFCYLKEDKKKKHHELDGSLSISESVYCFVKIF